MPNPDPPRTPPQRERSSAPEPTDLRRPGREPPGGFQRTPPSPSTLSRLQQFAQESPTSIRAGQQASDSDSRPASSDESDHNQPIVVERALFRAAFDHDIDGEDADDEDADVAFDHRADGEDANEADDEADDRDTDSDESTTQYDPVLKLPLAREFGDPGPKKFKTVLSVVCAELPRMADPYDVTLLKSTRGPQAADFDLDPAGQLENIVFVQDLVTQLVRRVEPLLYDLKLVDLDKDFLYDVLPWYTAKNNTSLCYSEVDVQRAFCNTLAQPTERVIKAILDRRSRSRSPSPPTVSQSKSHYPEFTSSEKRDVTADVVLRYASTRKAVVELKTTAVLLPNTDLFTPIIEATKNIPNPTDGDAVKFIWPTRTTFRTDFPKAQNTLCKLIVQIWSQLSHSNVKYGILSSISTTVFYYRDPKYPKTLYVSPSYSGEEYTFFHMISWVALSCGILEKYELQVPVPNTDWWTDTMKAPREAGLCLDSRSNIPKEIILPANTGDGSDHGYYESEHESDGKARRGHKRDGTYEPSDADED